VAPPREACQLIADGMEAYAILIDNYEKVKKAIKESIALSAKLQYGIADPQDVIGAELVSAIASISSIAADAALGAVSKAASSIIESIMSELLTLFLAAPTAIYSLVSIPHQQAMSAVMAERSKLSQANQNLNTILEIIAKWSAKMSGVDYYQQIQSALPYIRNAIDKSQQVMSQLGNVDYYGGGRNAYFDESTYNSMRLDIQYAIDILKPKSIIADKLGISNALKDAQEKNKRIAIASITRKYSAKKSQIDSEYMAELGKIPKNISALQRATAQQAIDFAWANKRKTLDLLKKEEMAAAEAKAAADAVTDIRIYVSRIGGIGAEFAYDVEVIGNNLLMFLLNIKNAYGNYVIYQNLCHTMVVMQDMISNLIQELISMIRASGNVAADAVLAGLRSGQALLMTAEEKLSSATPQMSAMNLSTTVIAGYGLVKSADAINSGIITQSLIDLINSDDVLQASNDRFNAFIEKLIAIPDWDGAIAVWAVNPALGRSVPYIKLIADTTTLLAIIPTIGMSGNTDDQIKIKNQIADINSGFYVLNKHNFIVQSTLSYYVPYVGSEVGNLMKLLSQAGLLSTFAASMSIAAITAELVSTMSSLSIDDSNIPSYDNCRKPDAYPEMFGATTVTGAALSKLNLPSREMNPSFVGKVEDKVVERQKVKKKIEIQDYITGNKDSQLYDGGQVPAG
jgi:hypothetical protein